MRAAGLIHKSKGQIKIHRLIQSSYLGRASFEEQQEAFHVVSALLNDVFPKQRYGDPLYEEWPACAMYFLHAQTLARKWKFSGEKGRALQVSEDFLVLLSNAAW